MANGRSVDNPQVRFQRARRVRITADEPLAANADLDVLAGRQVWEIDVLPVALSVERLPETSPPRHEGTK